MWVSMFVPKSPSGKSGVFRSTNALATAYGVPQAALPAALTSATT
jgi:hypothetical protein